MLTRRDVLAKIWERNYLYLGPVEIERGATDMQRRQPENDEFRSRTYLSATYADTKYQFIAEVTTLSTPRALRSAVQRAKGLASREILEQQPERYPLVIAPYLSEQRLEDLVAEGVSGLDLCGNGVLVGRGLFVFKTGQKNRYPQSTRLRNAYRGTSSLVGRALLIRPEFGKVKELVEFINQRDGKISFSQVSKVLKQLAEDLLISREGGVIRVIQADGILDALAREYKPPRIADRWIGRCSLEAMADVLARVQDKMQDPDSRYALMGYSVAGKSIGFAGEPIRSIFTDEPVMQLLTGIDGGIEEGRRFANLEILRTDSDWVYFGRSQYGGPSVSDVQAYLELANGDKRQKEASLQLRERILANLSDRRPAP